MRRALAIAVAFALSGGARAHAQPQTAAVNRAFDLEQAGKFREAIAAWREVIATGEPGPGVLGLERVFGILTQDDSVLPAIDTLLARAPGDRVLRGAQLRVLRSLGRTPAARKAFEEWTRIVPHDPVPYREFASQLLNDGRMAAADTVLQEATRALGSTKALTIELAQLRAGLGMWGSSAAAWRDAMVAEPYLETSAMYSLGSAPGVHRDSVRAVLRAAPGSAARKVLGMLDLQWGAGRDGWAALAMLTVADSAYQVWSDFADRAEQLGDWLAARDALAAMSRLRPSPTLGVRAANAALSGGDPGSALAMLTSARKGLTSVQVRTSVLPLEVRALAQMGRPGEAEKLVSDAGDGLDPLTRQSYARQIAWGWIRVGAVDKARAALVGASGEDEDEVNAWIALYDGNLARARIGLRRPSVATTEVVTAMALLGRTKADTSRTIGTAFLAMARGDSAQAAARFERAADELGDAAPLLIALAARIQTARRQDRAAVALWQRIAQQYAVAPEAAEADLEWGRSLRRKGDTTGAIERFEHLILSYPESALVPQARRELETVRNGASD